MCALARRKGVAAREVGRVRARAGTLSITAGAHAVVAPLERLARAYHDAIPAIMRRGAAELAVLEQHPSPAATV